MKSPAVVVGGSDSTRPSSCSSPPLARRSESISAVAPFTFTVMVTNWPDCRSFSVIVAFTPGPVICSTTLPEGTFFRVNVPSPLTSTVMFVPTMVILMPDGTVTLETEDVLAFWDPAPPLANETILPFTVTLEPDDGEVGDESPQAAA